MQTGKTTKRALVSSALAIVLCLAMLIGTTFAWFTDTASTSVNKIQAGNLKISLVDEDGNDLTNKQIRWTKKIDGNRVPAEDILWEPGCTYRTEQFYLRNDGNLAVKYRFNVSFTGDTKLLEVLEFTVKGWGTNFIGGFKGFLSLEEFNNYEGHLLPASESVAGSNPQAVSFEFKVHMKEEAGNEYQGLSLGDINITVLATQYTYENDSFGKTYDENAQYPVSSNEELSDALGNISSGETLNIAPGPYNLPTTGIPAGVKISGAGTDKTNLTMPATPYGKDKYTGLKINNSGVTISNATVAGDPAITSSDSYCSFIDVNADATVIDNVVINNNTNYTSSIVINRGVKKDSTVQISNVVLNGGFKPIHIVDGANGTVNIDNTEITATYTLNVNSSSSQDLVLNVTNSKLHGWTSYSPIKKASFINTEFSKGGSAYDFARPYADTLFENCTFDEEFKLGGGAAGKTYELNNCTYAGQKLTAENIVDMLITTGSDAPLLQCTIIVDGVTVSLS